MPKDNDRKYGPKKAKAVVTPTCTGCSKPLVPPLNRDGWCNGCWKRPGDLTERR